MTNFLRTPVGIMCYSFWMATITSVCAILTSVVYYYLAETDEKKSKMRKRIFTSAGLFLFWLIAAIITQIFFYRAGS
ncbi:hypothetical protein EI42_05636 [Thermosporothrix hazakensis]|uniref:Uncharacterized protein n=1 Tax=Thermosporothrix hazakensis TaxID=644383 RepID=A0A326TXK7_THEHA|nr:hypothetical protein EI42_05636 [Thermosporothrix hazakensis]